MGVGRRVGLCSQYLQMAVLQAIESEFTRYMNLHYPEEDGDSGREHDYMEAQMLRYLRHSKLREIRSFTDIQDPIEIDALRDMWETRAPHGRYVCDSKLSSTVQEWQWSISFRVQGAVFKTKKCAISRAEIPSLETAERVGIELAEFFDRWPLGHDDSVVSAALRSALYRVLPTKPLYLPEPARIDPRRPSAPFSSRFRHFDPATERAESAKADVTTSQVDSDEVRIPKLPGNVVYYSNDHHNALDIDGQTSFRRSVVDLESASLEQDPYGDQHHERLTLAESAQKLSAYIAFRLHDSIITTPNKSRLVQRIREESGARPRGTHLLQSGRCVLA